MVFAFILHSTRFLIAVHIGIANEYVGYWYQKLYKILYNNICK